MDTANPNPLPAPASLGDIELQHVTQEMYIKNAELAERNKTLLLLRQIDQIILSEITDTKQIAQQVASLVVKDADIKEIAIYLLEDQGKTLKILAVSETEAITQAEKQLKRSLHDEQIRVADNNLIAKSVVEAKVQATADFFNLLTASISMEDAKKIEEILCIKSSLVYPLVVRGQVIGAMVIGIGEDLNTLSTYRKDLIERLVGVIGIAIDNSVLYQNIQDANKRLKQLDLLKDEFVSLASHELRTPMTVIKSYLWFLLEGKKGAMTDEQKKYVETAYMSTERLINLVNDMLNVSRIESGRLTVNIKQMNILELIEKLIVGLQPRATELKLSLVFNKPTGDFPKALADTERVEQVFINLIGNSLKFTPEGGTITIGVKVENNMVLTSVSDTGKGIKAEDIPKLFQKFNMVGDSNFLTRQAIQGTGLGLYISKALIQLMKGTISVSSDGEGKGTTFSFTLPSVTNTESIQTLQGSEPVQAVGQG